MGEKDVCPICGSQEVGNSFAGDRRILKCRQCGVTFLSPDLITYNPEKYYSEGKNYASVVNSELKLKRIIENARQTLKLILKFVRPGSLLDIGAHTGMFVAQARKVSIDAIGIELNETSVAWAQKQSIPVRKSSIQEFNPQRKFDAVTLFHVLEHLKDPVGALKKIRGLLTENGYLIIEVPNFDSYPAKRDGSSWKFVALEHLFYFSEATLTRILSQLGFTITASVKRNSEIRSLNLRKILSYLSGKRIIRDRFSPKSSHVDSADSLNQAELSESLIKIAIKTSLVWIIKLLGREDHILIIAQKKYEIG